MVSYCNNTRRLAVGSRIGHIALYELRSSRCQLIPAHSTAVSALAFSPEGKVLASFSFGDAKISFWQVSARGSFCSFPIFPIFVFICFFWLIKAVMLQHILIFSVT